MAADVVLIALLGTWSCTRPSYSGAHYTYIFAAKHRGLFENDNVPKSVRNRERFVYRVEHVERNRYGYIGELYQGNATRYLFTIYAGKLALSNAEQSSTKDQAFYPVPDGDEYNCLPVKRSSP